MSVTPIHQQFLDYQQRIESRLVEKVSISGLVGPFRIFQRLKGHRHSIDDSTTAWYALQKSPKAEKALDLGAGVGTVGLAVLWGLAQEASLTCVEAQEVSFALLEANIKCNGVSDRVTAIHADLRDLHLDVRFSLITGSPPYFPQENGTLPKDSQKAHARFELRGHVGDYAEAAKRHLTPDGVFVYCFPFQQKARGLELVEKTGFKIVSVREVVPMKSKAPLFSLYSAKLECSEPTVQEPALIVAHADGKYTEDMLALQKTRGFGPEGTNIIQ